MEKKALVHLVGERNFVILISPEIGFKEIINHLNNSSHHDNEFICFLGEDENKSFIVRKSQIISIEEI